MGASSTTGVSGVGDSNQATTKDLSRWELGPQILLAGIATSIELDASASPPSYGGTVILPEPLLGLGEEHVVLLTTLNGGAAYIVDMNDEDLDGDDEDDHFTEFTFRTDSDCDVMYIVTKVGIRPD